MAEIDADLKKELEDLVTKIRRNSNSTVTSLSGARTRLKNNVTWADDALAKLKAATVPASPPDPDPEPEPEPEPPSPPTGTPAGYTKRVASGNFINNPPAYSFYEGQDVNGFFCDDVNHIWFRNMDFGPSMNQYLAFRGATKVVDTIVIENCKIHDMRVNNWEAHTEGIWISNARNVIIRNNVFERNSHFHIAFRAWPFDLIENVLVENNTFDDGWNGGPTNGMNYSYYNVQCELNHQITFKNNKFKQAVNVGTKTGGFSVARNGTYGRSVFEGNTWI